MNNPILVQLVFIDLSFENIDSNKVYRCLASNSYTLEEIYVMDLPKKVLLKKLMPIIMIHNYRYSKRLQNKLFVGSYKIIFGKVRQIIGNPNNHANGNPIFNQDPQILCQPQNNVLMKYIEERQKVQIQKPPQIQLSIYNLKLESQNYYVIAKVIEYSNLKYCSNEIWQGDYFFLQVEDQEYQQIRITFYERHCHNFINAFQVGEVYEFHNFQIKTRTHNSNNCQHQFYLNCQDDSSIKKSPVLIDQGYITIDQIKKKQIGDLINLIAFVSVESNKTFYEGQKKLERRSLALKDATGSIKLNIWNPQEHKIYLLGQVIMGFQNIRIGQFQKDIELNSTPSSKFIQSQQQLQKEKVFLQLRQQLQNPDFLNLQHNRNTPFCLQKELGKQINKHSQIIQESDDDDSEGFQVNLKVENWDKKSGKSIPNILHSLESKLNSSGRKQFFDRSLSQTDDTPPKSPHKIFQQQKHL